MRSSVILPFLASLALLLGSHAAAGEGGGRDADQQVEALNVIVDELKDPFPDADDLERVSRGERINRAFVMLTGEAVNPLLGVTALGIYNYLRTDDALRARLPLHDQPVVWAPLLAIILLMLFNSTLCEAMPLLKVPLNALGDLVNKAGAVALLPLMVKMFADAVATPAARHLAAFADTAFPAAQAAEAGAVDMVWYALAWTAGALVALLVYLAVWMTFNVVDVLILICPFPGVDAMLKSFRLSVIGLLAATYQFSPGLAALLALAVVAVSLALAGWSFRLSIFGLVFSTDILFFRRAAADPARGLPAFSTLGIAGPAHRLPMRTLGRLEKNADGELIFSYRPWLLLPRRTRTLGKASAFACGVGLWNPFIVANDSSASPFLRLPPRYRHAADALAGTFGLSGTVPCGMGGSLRTWLKAQFGGGTAAA